MKGFVGILAKKFLLIVVGSKRWPLKQGRRSAILREFDFHPRDAELMSSQDSTVLTQEDKNEEE
jgi:hypothetical protein